MHEKLKNSNTLLDCSFENAALITMMNSYVSLVWVITVCVTLVITDEFLVGALPPVRQEDLQPIWDFTM